MSAAEGPSPAGTRLLRKALRQSGWSTLQQIGVKGVWFLVHLGFARLLLPRHFGLVAEATVFTALLSIIGRLGLRVALVQRESVEAEDLSTATWASFALAGLVLASAVALGPLAHLVFGQPELVRLVPAMAAGPALTVASLVPRAVLERRMDFRSLSLIRLGAGITGGVLGVSLAVLGFGVWSFVGHTVATAAGVTAAAWWVARPGLPARFSKERFRKLIQFGGAFTGEQFFNFVSRRADDLVIGIFLGDTALGYYRIAYLALEGLTGIFGRAANAVALPVFSRAGQDDGLLRRRFLAAVEGAALLSLPACAGFALLADPLIPLVLGEKWLEAVPAARILSAVAFGHSVLLLNATAMYAKGRSDLQLRLAALYAVVNVVGFTIGVRWGIVGVSVAFALETFLTAPVELTVLRRLVDLEWGAYLEKLWRPLIASGAMTAGLVVLRRAGMEGSVGTLVVTIPAGLALYVSALVAIDRSYVRELANHLRTALQGRTGA